MNKKKKFLLLCASKKSDLPAAYTALEYLESSGTQYIDTGIYLSNAHNVTVQAQQVTSSAASMALFGSQDDGNATSFALSLYGAAQGFFGWFFYKTVSQAISLNLTPGVNSFDSLAYAVVNGRLLINGSLLPLSTASGAFTAGRPCWVFARNSYAAPTKFIGRIFAFEIAGAANMKLIPALRNADGVPGMFDTVSKQFFTNAGTGVFGYRVKGAPAAFSLRDPHRVAPSGVYARKVSETELEIIADTEETSGDGWEWFASSADAMEHFGINMSEQI
jgi:hypothetical protein